MELTLENIHGPHHNQPVLTYGASLQQAKRVMIMVHGRGASAADILTIADEINNPHMAYIAPQAHNFTWYPYSFMEKTEHNQPDLDSALMVLNSLINQVSATGIPPEKIFLLGFSQGACLALEFAVRNPQRYAGLFGLSGGLIGPIGTTWLQTGSFAGTPVFLGCSDIDPHIPLERIKETSNIFQKFDAQVTTRIYPGMGHTINIDELNFITSITQQE